MTQVLAMQSDLMHSACLWLYQYNRRVGLFIVCNNSECSLCRLDFLCQVIVETRKFSSFTNSILMTCNAARTGEMEPQSLGSIGIIFAIVDFSFQLTQNFIHGPPRFKYILQCRLSLNSSIRSTYPVPQTSLANFFLTISIWMLTVTTRCNMISRRSPARKLAFDSGQIDFLTLIPIQYAFSQLFGYLLLLRNDTQSRRESIKAMNWTQSIF